MKVIELLNSNQTLTIPALANYGVKDFMLCHYNKAVSIPDEALLDPQVVVCLDRGFIRVVEQTQEETTETVTEETPLEEASVADVDSVVEEEQVELQAEVVEENQTAEDIVTEVEAVEEAEPHTTVDILVDESWSKPAQKRTKLIKQATHEQLVEILAYADLHPTLRALAEDCLKG